MSNVEDRLRVAGIALEWLNTPYVHEGRIKHLCADCTFFAKVFEEAQLIPPVEIPHYQPQAHLHRGTGTYITLVSRYAKREVSESEAQVADVVLYHIGRTWSHGGVIIAPGWPEIIHADLTARKVQLARGDSGRLAGHERKFFSFW